MQPVYQHLLIVAPHADDELIGCYRLLKDPQFTRKTVIVCSDELTPVRSEEARKASEGLEYTLEVCDASNVGDAVRKVLNSSKKSHTLVMLPHISDGHSLHKHVNQCVRTSLSRIPVPVPYSVRYYSVDMEPVTCPAVLSPSAQEDKARLLHAMYPSQSELFSSDAKYYLFESFCLSDVAVSITVTAKFEGALSFYFVPSNSDSVSFPKRCVITVALSLEAWDNDHIDSLRVKSDLGAWVKEHGSQIQNSSYEEVGHMVLNEFTGKYPKRSCTVRVSDDEENSATVRWTYATPL